MVDGGSGLLLPVRVSTSPAAPVRRYGSMLREVLALRLLLAVLVARRCGLLPGVLIVAGDPSPMRSHRSRRTSHIAVRLQTLLLLQLAAGIPRAPFPASRPPGPASGASARGRRCDVLRHWGHWPSAQRHRPTGSVNPHEPFRSGARVLEVSREPLSPDLRGPRHPAAPRCPGRPPM